MGLRDTSTPVQQVEGSPILISPNAPSSSSSLADLKEQLQLSATDSGSGAASVSATSRDPAPFVRQTAAAEANAAALKGDALIDHVQAQTAQRTTEQNRLLNLVSSSSSLVADKMHADPDYAKSILSVAQDLKGPDRAQFLIDEADKIKIDQLKKERPYYFSSVGSALSGLAETFTLGQADRIGGLVDNARGIRSPNSSALESTSQQIGDNIDDRVEQSRLLNKAFHKSNLLGQLGGFMVPGSEAGEIFHGASQLTGSLLKTGLGKLTTASARDPGLVSRMISSGLKSAVGGGAVSLARGTLGEGTDDPSLSNGLEQAKSGFLWSGVGGLVAEGISSGAVGTARLLQKSPELAADGLSQLSGANKEALRAYNAQSPNMEFSELAGTQRKIADEVVNYVYDDHENTIDELKTARDMLPILPDVSTKPFFDDLNGQLAKLKNPDAIKAKNNLLPWVQYFQNEMKGTSDVFPEKIPASQMNGIKEDLQKIVDQGGGYDSPDAKLYIKGLRGFGAAARTAILRNAAEDTSLTTAPDGSPITNGALYTNLMATAADKAETLDKIAAYLGRTEEAAARKSESFISNMFGKNKSLLQDRMQDLDSKFKTNFLERIKNADLASSLGPDGIPALLPQQTTGKSLLGTTTGASIGSGVGSMVAGPAGAVVGGSVGSAAGNLSSSPKMAARIMGSSDKILGFLGSVLPDTLDKVANAKGFPGIVRSTAADLSKTLQEQGPKSASGLVRVIADTPIFLGLVNAYDIMDRKRQEESVKNLKR